MNWATVAGTAPKPAPAGPEHAPGERVAVVDANALITQHGILNLVRFADRCVTTPEVLREVRDKQSRAALEALPFTLDTLEPHEESVKALVRFARATGDIHALSSADMRLIALAHQLELGAHGGGHLRAMPEPAQVKKKRVHDVKNLPGWGVEGGEWAEIDRLNEEEAAAAEALLLGEAGEAGASRIASQVQQLSLGGGEEGGEGGEGGSGGEEGDSESEEEDEGEWETARTSNAAARKARKKAARKAAWDARQAEAGEAAGEQYEEEEESSDEEEEEAGAARGEDDACSLASDDEATAATAEAASPAAGGGGGDASAAQQQQQQGAEGALEGAAAVPFESRICIITADFAMQNVIMQMGLRLVTPDGRRITRLSRWVLRCTACFLVTKEMGRLFCPRCGNAALDKVQLVVGPDGAEQYGVRRKHVLRGTRFSLPKPKGGRYNDIILREDQLLAKAHRLRSKKKEAAELDPFAPEFGEDTWHKAAGLHYNNKNAQALIAGWKNNPNERKHVATNRRRK